MSNRAGHSGGESLEEYFRTIGPAAAAYGSPDHRAALVARAQEGDLAARNELMVSVVRYVVKFAQRYRNRGIPLEDLVQEGMLGVARAVELYDAGTGFTFLTYATHWIRARVTRAIAERGSLVRVPTLLYQATIQRARVVVELGYLLGRDPFAEEVDAEVAKWGGQRDPKHPLPDPKRIDLARKALAGFWAVGERQDRHDSPFDLTVEPESREPDVAERAVDRVAVLLALSFLRPRERQVITMRYGLFESGEHTLEEVGRAMKPPVSRERVRQIEGVALRRLRSVLVDGSG